jgi:MFS family permease
VTFSTPIKAPGESDTFLERHFKSIQAAYTECTMQITGARVPISRYFALSSYWFGFSFHWFVLLPILMPADVVRLVGETNKASYLGWLQGVAAVVPLILPPFLGAWSDRLGKRMQFLAWGTVLNVIGLVGMFLAPSYATYFLAYLFVQLGNAIASSPYTALIPDLVDPHDRGRASGVMGMFQLIGQIAGGIALFAVSSRLGQYAVTALVIGMGALITYLNFSEPPAKTRDTHAPWSTYFKPEYRDFRWVFLTRAFTETGRFAVQPFLAFFLADVIGTFQIGPLKLETPTLALTLTFILLSVTAAITSIASGPLSDRIGKKPIIYMAGATMSIAALGFALVKTFPLAVLMGLIFGLGYGAFISVDWALGTSVLPNPSRNARDMGVWHVAMVLPQLFQGPLGQILDAGNRASKNSGYPILFAIAVTFFVLGTVFISRVRGVK